MNPAEILVSAAGVYLALGVLFAVPFVAKGVARVDPDAVHGSVGFRLLIFPGTVALWPYLLRRWRSSAPPPEEATPHKRAAREAAGGPR